MKDTKEIHDKYRDARDASNGYHPHSLAGILEDLEAHHVTLQRRYEETLNALRLEADLRRKELSQVKELEKERDLLKCDLENEKSCREADLDWYRVKHAESAETLRELTDERDALKARMEIVAGDEPKQRLLNDLQAAHNDLAEAKRNAARQALIIDRLLATS